MQIVIDISHNLYESIIKDYDLSELGYHELYKAIQKGTPLPEHHGRLLILDEGLVHANSIKVDALSCQEWISEVGISNSVVKIIPATKEVWSKAGREENKMINIQLGRMGSDCTSLYYVTISKPMCVGDFIEEWLKENPREWGRFEISQGGGGFFRYLVWEYRYGQLLSKPDDKWLSRKIKEVKGSGGWSNSDFIFILEDEE